MNGKAHRIVGTFAGLSAAGFAVRKQAGINFAIEALAGGLGGYVGGQLPNVLDPPSLGPRHRRFAHSATVLAIDGAATIKGLGTFQNWCRENADARDARAAETSGLASFGHSLLAFLWRIFSGFAAGVLAGYGSHLVLDAFTPASLPLV